MISEDNIAATLVKAITALGDVAGTFYVKSTTDTFDPLTSDTVSSTTLVQSKGVLDTTRVYYLDEKALTDAHYDLWLICENEVKLSDTIVDSSNVEHKIVKILNHKTNTKSYIYRIGLQI
jgi:hypothetical protein